MQPGTHELVIRKAVAQAGLPLLQERLPDLLAGNDDEDVHIVPLLGWRLQAAGLTHTYRYGRRFGELFAPSALSRTETLLAQAQARLDRDPRGGWRRVGRACHLLGDAAVPARTRGVWHLLGDPFEEWCEANLPAAEAFEPSQLPAATTVRDVFDGLAKLSSTFRADTTRTPWGKLRVGRSRVEIGAVEAQAQAEVLLPAAAAHTAALLLGFVRRALPA